MKKIYSKDKIMFSAYIFLWVIICIFFLLSVLTRNDDSVRKINADDYSTGWKTENNMIADLSNLTHVSYIYKSIDVKEDETLFYSVRNANTKVYIGDKLVASDVVNNEFLYGKTRGTSINHITIKKEDSGKTIKIEFDKPTSKKVLIPEILIGDGYDIMKKILPNKILPAGLSYSIIAIGGLLLISFGSLRRKKLVGPEVLYLSLFSINLGLFLLIDNKLFPILGGYEAVTHTFAEIFMMTLVIPLLLYIGRVYNIKNKKPIYFISWMSFTFAVICFILNFLCIKDFSETVWLTHITYGAAALCIIYMSFKYLLETNNKKIYHFLAMISLIIGCAVDIIILYFGSSISTSIFTETGILFFLIFECSDIMQIQLELYGENKHKEMLAKLAYHDGLTELLNRTSYVETLEELKNNKTTTLVCMFDVNNLKLVNDNIGHQAGDELIKTAAETISNSFKEYGNVYRIGGDEFVALVTKNPTKDLFNKQIEVMNKYLDDYNNSNNNPYIVSVAYGCDIYKSTSRKSLEKVIETADKNMYKKKNEIKSSKNYNKKNRTL